MDFSLTCLNIHVYDSTSTRTGQFAMKIAARNPLLRNLLLSTLAIASLFVMSACQQPAQVVSTAVSFATPYQAVLLTNNSVYFGKLSGYGTSNPVLTDVFYILSQTDPQTKQVKNILVKRGKELHGPDRMYLNPSSIVFVEPVGTDSKVAQLIQEAANQQK
jgi:small nuclear ribonucleoprotein (snRNP)-like protein